MVISFAIGSVLVFIFSYGYLLDGADYIFFKSRESRLNEFVKQIKRYGKIKEMSDGLRYWKTINNKSIEPYIYDVDTLTELGKKYFLDDVLKNENITSEIYEKFRFRLIDLNFISFNTLDNGTISFTIDGFLDNCTGFAYSESGVAPAGNDCGRIIHWVKVGDNWFVWYTT